MNRYFSECGKCTFYDPVKPKSKDEANAIVRGWMWGGMCNNIKRFKRRHHVNPLSESCEYGEPIKEIINSIMPDKNTKSD